MWPILFVLVLAAVLVTAVATRTFLGLVIVVAISVLAGFVTGVSGWPEEDIWFAQVFPLATLLVFTVGLIAFDHYQRLVEQRYRARASRATLHLASRKSVMDPAG